MYQILYDLSLEKVFEDGTVVLTYDGCIEMAKRNKNFHKFVVENDDRFQKYNRFSDKKVIFHDGTFSKREHNWILPEEYQEINILGYCLNLCDNKLDYIERVNREYVEFEKRNLIDALRFMKFFMDVIIEEDICIGVGRGSSCASVIMFLLGVNQVDPMLYEIPLEEFLR